MVSGAERVTRVLAWLAIAGIAAAILIMIGASLVRSSWMLPPMDMPAAGPPWGLQTVHVPAAMVTLALWLSAILGGGSVAAGLLAVQRGARPSLRLLFAVAVVAVAALVVLPPVGSTDALDYATYGRIMALGHSPYVMTPYHLRVTQNAFARSVPAKWENQVSVYGPLATTEQFLAAKLGGASPARIVFWLKLWNAIAFGIVAVVADRLLRSNPAMRMRAHLLWTVNPLLLWSLLAAGHLDLLAAAAGLLGLMTLGEQPGTARADRYGTALAGQSAIPLTRQPWPQLLRPGLVRVLAAGALLGVAADIKINYVLFGLGAAWVLRRSPAALAAAAGGALAVVVPTYAWFGLPAVRALFSRRDADNFYELFFYPHQVWRPQIAVMAAVLVVGVAGLLLRRMPPGTAGRTAIRPALALSVAWLFFWPYQLPWYETMSICLLVLYPATQLDWLVLARLTASTTANMPGNAWFPRASQLAVINRDNMVVMAPMVLLAAGGCVVALCWSRRWKPSQPGVPPPPRADGGPFEPLQSTTAGGVP